MKKKLEADLISIAHRILKLKNRAELDQLQQETLKLYEKLSVLKFVEDNFKGVQPTIGYASAQEKLEDIYGLDETELAKPEPGELDKQVDEKAAARKEKQEVEAREQPKQDKENESGEGVDADTDGKLPVAEEEKEITDDKEDADDKEEAKGEPDDDVEGDAPDQEEEQPEEDKEEEKIKEPAKEDKPEEIKEPEEDAPKEEAKTAAKEPENNEPEIKVQVEKSEADLKAMEAAAASVYQKEDESTLEEEEQAADAEIKTIEPERDTKTEAPTAGFNFAFERKPAPEEPVKQKEISFEDFHDYKEPEFVKKDNDAPKADANDWRNWEPAKTAAQDKPVEEAKQPEAKQPEQPKPAAPKSLNDGYGKSINLALNDRVAFEKNLFGSSADDLNRVLSQLNTFNSYTEARNFIEDLVKPDYNNWKGKEEYEERFMAIVEKRFS